MLGGEGTAVHSGLQTHCAGHGLADGLSHRCINYREGRSKLQGQGAGVREKALCHRSTSVL